MPSVRETRDIVTGQDTRSVARDGRSPGNDVGDYADQGGDAIRLLDWLAERETFYPVEIHTANPVGRANMERILARYWGEQYW